MRNGFFTLISAVALAAGTAVTLDLRGQGSGPKSRDIHDPANAVANLDVHKDLQATLFASEPMITNPTNLDIDYRGRVSASSCVQAKMTAARASTKDAGDERLAGRKRSPPSGRPDQCNAWRRGNGRFHAPRSRWLTVHRSPVLYEFWAVATRPISNNGLGLSSAECLHEVANIKTSFSLLDDKPTLFIEWEVVVTAFACHGKTAHDARYVATMRTHGLSHLLTFNASDFRRFTGITLLDPNIVVASGPPSKSP